MKGRLAVAVLLVSGSWWVVRILPVAQAQNSAAAREGQRRPEAYPDRPKAPQEVLDRGRATYGVSCGFCHGSDAGGGEVGPNLLRSGVVLEDQAGELLAPIVHGSRVDKGMPRVDISDAQISDIAAWLHSLKVASRTDADDNINIVRGDAKAGEAYFQKTCASCHSITGDLKGFAAKMPNPKILQQTWILPGGGGGRATGGGGASVPGLHVPPVTVTVTEPNGEKVTGVLSRIDDFYVGLTEANGMVRGFDRMGSTPKVEIHDPLAAHRALMGKYSDKDIHDVTAYLVTLP